VKRTKSFMYIELYISTLSVVKNSFFGEHSEKLYELTVIIGRKGQFGEEGGRGKMEEGRGIGRKNKAKPRAARVHIAHLRYFDWSAFSSAAFLLTLCFSRFSFDSQSFMFFGGLLFGAVK